MEGPSLKKKSLKIKYVPTSDSEPDVEDDVLDIVSSSRRKVGWKRISLNVPSAPLDIVSFHSKASVWKWKYVFQRKGCFLVVFFV